MSTLRMLGAGQVIFLLVLAGALLYLGHVLALPPAWHSIIMMLITLGVAGLADSWTRERIGR